MSNQEASVSTGVVMPMHAPLSGTDGDALRVLQRHIDLELPEETTQLWDVAIRLENEAALNLVKRGVAYLTLKDRLGAGCFIQGLEQRGIAPRRAQEAMAVAKFLMSLPQTKARAFARLAKSKLIELARIPPESVEHWADQEHLEVDDMDTMSVRDLKQRIKAVTARAEQAESACKAAEQHLLDQELQKFAGGGQPSSTVSRIKVDGAFLAEKILLAADDMATLIADLSAASLSSPDIDYPDTPAVAADSLWIHVQAVLSRVGQLAEQFRRQLGEPSVIREEDIPLLTEDEARRVHSLRRIMTLEHHAERLAQAPVDGVAQVKPRKRGRPRLKQVEAL